MATRPRWCSVRLRLTPVEVALLRGAETVYGDVLGRQPRAAALREALSLMKAGQKVASASDVAPVALGEAEAAILLAALRHTQQELERYRDYVMGWRERESVDAQRLAVLERAFPSAKGSAWETSQLIRALQSLGSRLEAPLAVP